MVHLEAANCTIVFYFCNCKNILLSRDYTFVTFMAQTATNKYDNIFHHRIILLCYQITATFEIFTLPTLTPSSGLFALLAPILVQIHYLTEHRVAPILIQIQYLTEHRVAPILIQIHYLTEHRVAPILIQIQYLTEHRVAPILIQIHYLTEHRVAPILIQIQYLTEHRVAPSTTDHAPSLVHGVSRILEVLPSTRKYLENSVRDKT